MGYAPDSGAYLFVGIDTYPGKADIALFNSIVYGNTYFGVSQGTFETTNSCVQPGCTANLDATYHPTGGPPLADTGSSTVTGIGDTCDLDSDGNTSEIIPFDLDGRPRIAGAAIDIGPYEYQ